MKSYITAASALMLGVTSAPAYEQVYY